MALNRLGDRADGRCVAVLASDSEGQLRGCRATCRGVGTACPSISCAATPQAENGITEYSVAGLLAACPDLGVARVSLNFGMFRGIFSAAERVGAGPLVRLTNRLLTFASGFWQLESLYRSNERYLPSWTPRYLCYDSTLTLARVAAAAGAAEGFLPDLSRTPEAPRTGVVRWGDRVDTSFQDAVLEQERVALRRHRPARRVSHLERIRRGKIQVLADAGMPAYPVSVPRTADLSAVRAAHVDLAPSMATGERVAVAGRVRAVRDFGSLVFVVLQDGEHRQAIVDCDRTAPTRRCCCGARSTSAITSASAARSSRARAGKSPCTPTSGRWRRNACVHCPITMPGSVIPTRASVSATSTSSSIRKRSRRCASASRRCGRCAARWSSASSTKP